jgi:hypothetical protein
VLITPALTSVNGAKVAAAVPIPGRPVPTMWTGPNASVDRGRSDGSPA